MSVQVMFFSEILSSNVCAFFRAAYMLVCIMILINKNSLKIKRESSFEEESSDSFPSETFRFFQILILLIFKHFETEFSA